MLGPPEGGQCAKGVDNGQRSESRVQAGVDVEGKIQLLVRIATATGVADDVTPIKQIVQIQGRRQLLEAQGVAEGSIVEGVAQAHVAVEPTAQGQETIPKAIVGITHFVEGNGALESMVPTDKP